MPGGCWHCLWSLAQLPTTLPCFIALFSPLSLPYSPSHPLPLLLPLLAFDSLPLLSHPFICLCVPLSAYRYRVDANAASGVSRARGSRALPFLPDDPEVCTRCLRAGCATMMLMRRYEGRNRNPLSRELPNDQVYMPKDANKKNSAFPKRVLAGWTQFLFTSFSSLLSLSLSLHFFSFSIIALTLLSPQFSRLSHRLTNRSTIHRTSDTTNNPQVPLGTFNGAIARSVDRCSTNSQRHTMCIYSYSSSIHFPYEISSTYTHRYVNLPTDVKNFEKRVSQWLLRGSISMGYSVSYLNSKFHRHVQKLIARIIFQIIILKCPIRRWAFKK